MEQYKMKANFRPVEPKNGHIGFADLTIADAIRINDISVFEKEGGGHSIRFPEFGEGEQRRSFVVPKSTEAHAQMLDVIVKAVNDQDKHFGWSTGKQNPYLEVSGKVVNETYADGRFSVEVGDLCTLYGIKTREVTYEKEEGKKGHFIAVDLPEGEPYEKDGKKIYPPLYEALKDGTVYNKETKQEEKKDFETLLINLVKAERKKEMEKKPSLEDQIAGAEQKAAEAPAKEIDWKKAAAKKTADKKAEPEH